MDTICTSLQTDNHASTSSVNFLQDACSSWWSSNTVKSLKVTVCSFVCLSTPASSLTDVNITQQIVAIYKQPSRGVNLNQQSTSRTADKCVHHCAQLSYNIQHRTDLVLIIFPLSSRQSSLLRCCLLEERDKQTATDNNDNIWPSQALHT